MENDAATISERPQHAYDEDYVWVDSLDELDEWVDIEQDIRVHDEHDSEPLVAVSARKHF